MAIVLNTEAANTSSVNNEMLFVAYEATKANDPVTYPDYSYVCDIYVSSTLIARLKARPDPLYKRGVFDVSKVLQAYATYGLKASSFKEDYTIKINYQLKFGEEYDFTLYPNLLVDSSDRSCFTTYMARPFTSTSVLNNGIASNLPSVISYNRNELYHFIPVYSNVTGVVDGTLSVIFYDNSNNNVGSGSLSNSDYVLNTIRQINIASISIPATATYAIYTGIASFRVNYLCNGKYTPYTLAWLNPYGGYDSMSFGFVSKKNIDIYKKDFSQIPYKLDASGNVSYQNNNVFYGSKKSFAANVQTKLSLTSHLLTDAEYRWMADLFISPDVYLYDTNLSKFVPVRITANNYEYRTYANSKLTPLKLDIEFTDIYNAQNL